MRFTITQAQVPTAAKDEEINRTWFVKGTNEDGTNFMGYMPRDEVPDVKDSNELLGMTVEGEEHPVQRQPGRVWINYLRPAKKQSVDKHGSIAELAAEKTMKQQECIVEPDGTKYWYLNGKLHREDGPAAELPSGTKSWYLNGKLHREDGPAEERLDGTKMWCINGELHREDGPAEEWPSGTKKWYLNGKRHREDGPAEEWSDGTKRWFLSGNLHREDGPAEEWSDGTKRWFINGKEIFKSPINTHGLKVSDAIGEISAELNDIADRLTITAILLRSLKNL